jgi:thiol-disulfide isomerase/thioredoxin
VAPQFEQLSNRYMNVVFVKIDVDQMTVGFRWTPFEVATLYSLHFQETARQFGIRAMPTFLFFKNSQQVAQVQGANIPQIEANIKQFATGPNDSSAAADAKDGMVSGQLTHLFLFCR